MTNIIDWAKKIVLKNDSTCGFISGHEGLGKQYLRPVLQRSEHEVSISPFYAHGTLLQIMAKLKEPYLNNSYFMIPPDYGSIVIWINTPSCLPKIKANFANTVADNTIAILSRVGVNAFLGCLPNIISTVSDTALSLLSYPGVTPVTEGVFKSAVRPGIRKGEKGIVTFMYNNLKLISQNVRSFCQNPGISIPDIIKSILSRKYIIQVGVGFPNTEKNLAAGTQYDTKKTKIRIDDLLLYFMLYESSTPIPFYMFEDFPYMDDD